MTTQAKRDRQKGRTPRTLADGTTIYAPERHIHVKGERCLRCRPLPRQPGDLLTGPEAFRQHRPVSLDQVLGRRRGFAQDTNMTSLRRSFARAAGNRFQQSIKRAVEGRGSRGE